VIPFEPRPQFLVVVYFTIYDDTNGFVFIEYGLMATFKIDDAQTPMSKRHVAVAKQAFVIRASVAKRMYHAQNDLLTYSLSRIEIDCATNAAHQLTTPPR
jgi:hypothetical protein